ncbi:hypothetical protein BDV3_002556 [Batrachochytrium dendrobatidis]
MQGLLDSDEKETFIDKVDDRSDCLEQIEEDEMDQEDGELSDHPSQDEQQTETDCIEESDPVHTGESQWVSISLANNDQNDNPWDDSLLIKAWDSAVKQYLNMERNGILPDRPGDDTKESSHSTRKRTTVDVTDLHLPKRSKPTITTSSALNQTAISTEIETTLNRSTSTETPIHASPCSTQFPGFKPNLLPQSKPSHHACPSCGIAPSKESLESTNKEDIQSKLMMAWYYTGYYTGLNERQ